MGGNRSNMSKQRLGNKLYEVGEKYDFYWGFKDTRFELKENGVLYINGDRYPVSGCELPDFMPYIQELLHIDVDTKHPREESIKTPPPAYINKPFLSEIQKLFSEHKYSFDDRVRLTHSHGQTTANEVFKVLYYELQRVTDMVFFAEEEKDIEVLINLAKKHDVCIVPYGGGTNVSCALQLPIDERRMIISLDMRRLNAIEWIDKNNFRACVQSGIVGIDLERKLQEQGFTMGHEPDSIEFSTLGGWIATNASGMKKNRYGNIEEIIETIRLLTPRGVMEPMVGFPRSSMGMQPQQIILGSEGNLGVITKAVVRIRPLPEHTKFGSYVFRDFDTGMNFLRDVAQQDVLPSSIRLMDNLQFRFGLALRPRGGRWSYIKRKLEQFLLTKGKGFDLRKTVVVTCVYEGTHFELTTQQKVMSRFAKKHEGISAGAKNGQRGYLLTYLIAYIRDFVGRYHVFGETYETTVPWDRVLEVCKRVQEEAQKQHKKYGFPGTVYIAPRITQLYRTGVCIYFTHGFSTHGVENGEDKFILIERHMRKTIMDSGGSISHHHGVGKIRSMFVKDLLSSASRDLLKKVKEFLDPSNIFCISNNIFDKS